MEVHAEEDGPEVEGRTPVAGNVGAAPIGTAVKPAGKALLGLVFEARCGGGPRPVAKALPEDFPRVALAGSMIENMLFQIPMHLVRGCHGGIGVVGDH